MRIWKIQFFIRIMNYNKICTSFKKNWEFWEIATLIIQTLIFRLNLNFHKKKRYLFETLVCKLNIKNAFLASKLLLTLSVCLSKYDPTSNRNNIRNFHKASSSTSTKMIPQFQIIYKTMKLTSKAWPRTSCCAPPACGTARKPTPSAPSIPVSRQRAVWRPKCHPGGAPCHRDSRVGALWGWSRSCWRTIYSGVSWAIPGRGAPCHSGRGNAWPSRYGRSCGWAGCCSSSCGAAKGSCSDCADPRRQFNNYVSILEI